MLCQPCAAQIPRGSRPRQPATASRVQLCEQCGAAIVTLKGVTGEPLLELRRGGI